MAGDPSPLHGQGWLSPWAVERVGERAATLSFQHSAGEWPWVYEARQEFALDERGLSVTLSCRNLSDEPMPCGLGQHPYFGCGSETVLDTRVSHVWTIDEHVLPVEKVPAEGRFDLRRRRVCGQDLDHGFDNWGGLAWMNDPSWPYELATFIDERGVLPTLLADCRWNLRCRASDPRQCRAQCARRPVAGAWHAGARTREVHEPRHAAGGRSEIAARSG